MKEVNYLQMLSPGSLESENQLPVPKRKSEFRMRKSWARERERERDLPLGLRAQEDTCSVATLLLMREPRRLVTKFPPLPWD